MLDLKGNSNWLLGVETFFFFFFLSHGTILVPGINIAAKIV